MHLVTASGRDEAGCLAYWRQRGPYRMTALPPFTPYAPLLLRTQPNEARIHTRRSALEALLATLEAHFARLSFFVLLPDVRPASWRGWTATPFYTYLLPLQHDDLLERWSGGTRRLFQNHRAAYRVEEGRDPTSILALSAGSYQRHARSLPGEEARLAQLIETLRDAGLARLFTATPLDGSTPEGGVVILQDGQTAHDWIAGSTRGPAMTVLLGHTLSCLRDAGIQQFDFVGANTPSIAEFKRHFGPVLTPYYHLEKITRPELRLYSRLRGS